MLISSLIVFSLLAPRSSIKLLLFLWGPIYPFFANLFLYFYESKWIIELKKNDLIKARGLFNILRFTDDLDSISDGGEYKRSYSYINPEELQLTKENTDNKEASFPD